MSLSSKNIDRRTLIKAAGGAGVGAMLAGLARPAIAQQAERTLRFTSLFGPGHPDFVTADFFADELAKRTGGKLRIKVFHNGSLGGDLETVQGIRTGTIDMGRAGSSGVATFIPDIRVMELPYLFRDLDTVRTSAEACTPILQELFRPNNLDLLGYEFDGPRMTLSTKPIKSFENMKGLRVRAPEAPNFIQMIKSWGAVPTPISLPEVYMALQSRVVDALEGSPSTLYSGKYYEVAKTLLRTDHICNAQFLVINTKVMASLPADQQQIIRDIGKAATDMNLKLANEVNVDDLDRLQKAGVVEYKPDLKPFIEAATRFSEDYAQKVGGRGPEIYKIAKAAAGKA